MKYEPMIWYGWNGGQCPVHPKTEVEWVHMCGDCKGIGCAGDFEWGEGATGIVAFRVTKEHKEPREFWLAGFDGDTSTVLCCEPEDDGYYDEVIHVREVV